MTKGRRNTAESVMRRLERAPGGCWLWPEKLNNQGYGLVSMSGGYRLVHRVVFEHARGPIPDGMVLDHLCRVRNCANPDHLEPVTQGENSRRGLVGDWQKQKTHCPRGHEYTPQNTGRKGNGGRYCRTCKAERTRIEYASRREYHRQYMRAWRKLARNQSATVTKKENQK